CTRQDHRPPAPRAEVPELRVTIIDVRVEPVLRQFAALALVRGAHVVGKEGEHHGTETEREGAHPLDVTALAAGRIRHYAGGGDEGAPDDVENKLGRA